MNIKQKMSMLVGAMLGASLATAGGIDVDAITTPQRFRPVVSLQGGYAVINEDSNTRHFISTDAEEFTYTNSGSNKNTGFIGVFLGVEHILPWIADPNFFVQAGVEYNYFGSIDIKGINTAGIEPQTSTIYNYHYSFQTQQLLGTLKLFATAFERLHPYGEVGIGAAFNRAEDYRATTAETGGINLTPRFSDQNKTQFSYILGLGIDTQVYTNILVGIGYRYSHFGSSSLGNGTVTFHNYQSPVSFGLDNPTYANQLIAHINLVI